jgi:hypothetical protein
MGLLILFEAVAVATAAAAAMVAYCGGRLFCTWKDIA